MHVCLLGQTTGDKVQPWKEYRQEHKHVFSASRMSTLKVHDKQLLSWWHAATSDEHGMQLRMRQKQLRVHALDSSSALGQLLMWLGVSLYMTLDGFQLTVHASAIPSEAHHAGRAKGAA